jgi:hypothetical protein
VTENTYDKPVRTEALLIKIESVGSLAGKRVEEDPLVLAWGEEVAGAKGKGIFFPDLYM